MNLYRCKHCGSVVERDSEKAWIKSICGTMGRDVYLMRVKGTDSEEHEGKPNPTNEADRRGDRGGHMMESLQSETLP